MAQTDRRSLAVRLSLLQAIVVVCFGGLAVAFWAFQVAQHNRYRELAENNHLRTLPLRAPRGTLTDRHGKVLVENRFAFNILLVRERTDDVAASIRRLASVTGVDEEELQAVLRERSGEPAYRPLTMIEDATLAQVAAVSARQYELKEIVIDQVPTRHYPDAELAAHLIGYVGEVSRSQLSDPEYAHASSGDVVGKSGVEREHDALITGLDGARHVIVNSVGREIETVGEQPPVQGKRLMLTIDYDVQRAVEEGFRKSGYTGSAVILDPRSGEVLAFVSLPAYDPNLFASGIDSAAWSSLTTNRLHPLQNRAIQGRYSPGSTFKIVVAVAGLQEGVITPSFRVFCGGGAYFYGRYFRCHLAGGHGSMDLRHAIEKSCNTYFYTVGNMVGIDRLHKWATALGLGVLSGIDLPNEVEGIMPSSEWKRRTTGEKWYAGETISVAIGQGQVSVTPISLAVMMATVANGGTRYVPHLVKAVDNGEGWEPVPPPPPASEVHFKDSTLKAVRDGLWMVVNAAGTGGRARIPGRDVAGKTGTAQVISLQGRQRAGDTDKDLRDHGFFVFFAPRDEPELAGVVFAEHSEHGYLAAPIAKFAIETYFAKQEGRPLPEWPAPRPPAPAPAPPQVVAGGEF